MKTVEVNCSSRCESSQCLCAAEFGHKDNHFCMGDLSHDSHMWNATWEEKIDKYRYDDATGERRRVV